MKNKILVFIIAVLSFAVGVLLAMVIKLQPSKNTKVIDNQEMTVNQYTINESGISEPVKKVYNSVVLIENLKGNTLQGSGSGFVYKKDKDYAYILTNQHVINNAAKVTVKFANKEKIEGKLLGSDQILDIAVVRIPASDDIKALTLSTSKNLVLGELVFAIGSPVSNEYFNSVTGGFISGLNRKVAVQSDMLQNVIQIDVAINPGNSGGPLFNIKGDVIGITSMKLVNDKIEGMGFAIPIEDALAHINELEENKKIERARLGITNTAVNDTRSLKTYEITLDESIKEGVVILEVSKDSVMEKAGFKKGDVIVKFNDEKIESPAILKFSLYKHRVGDSIKITYIRGKETKVATIKLTDKID